MRGSRAVASVESLRVVYTLGMWEGHGRLFPQLAVLGLLTAREGDAICHVSSVRLREER